MAKVFVAMPVAGGYYPQMITSLLQMVQSNPGGHELVFKPYVNESLISRARSRLASEFLASDCDALLMIDADLQFPPDALDRLFRHDKDVVGAPYAVKTIPTRWAVALGPDAPTYVEGLMPVRYVPGGFTLIRRRVLEALAKPQLAFYEEADDTPYYAFFLPMLQPREDGRPAFVSEDYAFCERARQAGFEVWCDFDIALQHWGLYRFEVSPVNGKLPSHPMRPVVDEFGAMAASVDSLMGQAAGAPAEYQAMLQGMMSSFAEVGDLLKQMVVPPGDEKQG